MRGLSLEAKSDFLLNLKDFGNSGKTTIFASSYAHCLFLSFFSPGMKAGCMEEERSVVMGNLFINVFFRSVFYLLMSFFINPFKGGVCEAKWRMTQTRLDYLDHDCKIVFV